MSAALLRKMAEKGLTIEDAIELIEAMEADRAPSLPKDRTSAERQARYRDRLGQTGMSARAWSKTRDRVLARDQHRCGYCTAPAVCVDHIQPLAQGGGSSDENLVAACNACNSGKSGRSLAEWKGQAWSEAWINARYGDALLTRDTSPLPLPSSPQTPQLPTPTPENNTRARKGRSAEPSSTDLTERIWQAASKTSRNRSGRPALGKAVLAAIKAGATDDALLASVRNHCEAQGEFAKGVHHVIAGEHWRDHVTRLEGPAQPVDPAVRAHRLQHFAKTGEWKPTWGDRPPANTNDQHHHGAAA